MTYDELMGSITAELPHLAGQLSEPQVVFVR